jgi:hypothetical protein
VWSASHASDVIRANKPAAGEIVASGQVILRSWTGKAMTTIKKGVIA